MLEFYEIDLEIHKNIPIKKPKFIEVFRILQTLVAPHSEQALLGAAEIDIKEYIFKTEKEYKTKKVTFNNIIYIHLIPYYDEIIQSSDDIWWNNNDFVKAVQESNKKIKDLLDIHPTMTYTQAKKILYHHLSYDKNNFDIKNI